MDTLHTQAKLRYRFATLSQARAHVREREGRALFFFAFALGEGKPPVRPRTRVCLELCFDDGEPNRLLHGVALAAVEGRGTWLELLDTRPVRELAPTEYTRKHRRMGCDLLVELRGEGRTETGRMLELSNGGARIRGLSGMMVNERVELSLLSPDGKASRPLSGAFVAWADSGEIGVRFDRLDSNSRNAVSRLVAHAEASWSRPLEATHPAGCCAPKGVLDPPLPAVGELTDTKS